MQDFIHRVKRGPKAPPAPPLPKDKWQWQGRTFIESDGTVCEVVYSGKHMPSVSLPRDSHGRWQTIGHPVIGAP